LAYAADNAGIPAAALGTIAERLAKSSFRRAQLADDRDWSGYLAAYSALDEEMVKSALNEP
jgi:3-phenylpropionate/cinnamic acid dioxygenase small subunit